MADAEQIIEAFKRAPTVEILTEERLKQAIESGVKLKHYICTFILKFFNNQF